MSFLDLLFPKFCLGCHKEGEYICKDCLAKVRVLNRFDPSTQTISIFKYEGVIRKAIIKLKYNFAYDIASDFASVCFQKLNTKYLIRNTILVPIPLYKSRQRWRGFNQSELVGKLLAEKLGWGFKNDLLTRPIEGQNQVGLRGIERVRNIRGKFAVKTSGLVSSDCCLIVFDDVATTGSTIKEAIKVLKKAGFSNTLGLTVAG